MLPLTLPTRHFREESQFVSRSCPLPIRFAERTASSINTPRMTTPTISDWAHDQSPCRQIPTMIATHTTFRTTRTAHHLPDMPRTLGARPPA